MYELRGIVPRRTTLGTSRVVACFGHAGDGNRHYDTVVDTDDPEQVAAGRAVSKRVIGRAVDLMRRIERAFDPNGILNPWKVFTESEH